MKQIIVAAELRLSSDPELRQSSSGKPWLSVSAIVANSDKGEPNSMWFKLKAFGELAEALAASCRKGDVCYVEGSLSQDRWIAKDGTEKTSLVVTAKLIQPLGLIGKRAKADKREPAPAQNDIPLELYATGPVSQDGDPGPWQADAIN